MNWKYNFALYYSLQFIQQDTPTCFSILCIFFTANMCKLAISLPVFSYAGIPLICNTWERWSMFSTTELELAALLVSSSSPDSGSGSGSFSCEGEHTSPGTVVTSVVTAAEVSLPYYIKSMSGHPLKINKSGSFFFWNCLPSFAT